MEEYQSYEGNEGFFAAMGATVMIIYCAVLLLIIVSLWKIFTKAGKPGWAAIIPIYNLIVLLGIVGKPAWWFLLMLIPIVNFFIGIYVAHLLSKSFGKDVVMTILLVFVPFIGYPMLAFGSATYGGPPKD